MLEHIRKGRPFRIANRNCVFANYQLHGPYNWETAISKPVPYGQIATTAYEAVYASMHPYDPNKKPHLSKIDRALRKRCKQLGLPDRVVQTDAILFIGKIKITSQKTISALAPYLPIQENPIQHYEYTYVWPLSFGNLEQIYSKAEGRTHVPVPALGRWKTLSNTDDIKLRKHIIATHARSANAQDAHSATAQQAHAQGAHNTSAQHARGTKRTRTSEAHQNIPHTQDIKMASKNRTAPSTGYQGKNAYKKPTNPVNNKHTPKTEEPARIDFAAIPELAKMILTIQSLCSKCGTSHGHTVCGFCYACGAKVTETQNNGSGLLAMCKGCFNSKPELARTKIRPTVDRICLAMIDLDPSWDKATVQRELFNSFPILEALITRFDAYAYSEANSAQSNETLANIDASMVTAVAKHAEEWAPRKKKLLAVIAALSAHIDATDFGIVKNGKVLKEHAASTATLFKAKRTPTNVTAREAYNHHKLVKEDADFMANPFADTILDSLRPIISTLKCRFETTELTQANWEAFKKQKTAKAAAATAADDSAASGSAGKTPTKTATK
jgi:hypothetical protein